MRGAIGAAVGCLVAVASAGKHEGGHSHGGKKHTGGVGYVEEGGIVGYSCHEGWEPQGEGPGMVCIRKEKLPLLPSCPIGFLEGEHCLLREPAIFSCPPGFVEVGGYDSGKKHGHGGGKKHGHDGGKKHGGGPLCMKIDRVPYEGYCQAGTVLSAGQCLRTEISPATMICPLDQYGGKKHGHGGGHGGKHDGGKKHSYIQPACVETIDVPPVPTCPPNLKLKGTMCYGHGQGPCPMAAPAPLILEGKKHKHGAEGYRRLGEEEDLNSAEPVDERMLVAEGEANANADANVADADANVADADANVSAAELERRLGEKHGHDGGKKDKHGGYGMPILPPVPSKMKMCDLEIIEPVIPVCPPGSFETGGYGGKKHGSGGKKHAGGYNGLGCAQTIDVPLEPYCPLPGAILNAATMTCESAVFEAELQRCPLGFEPCDMGHGGKKDKHGGHHGGKKDKHGGYGAGCCAVQYADPLPGCPMGAQLFGGQCIIKHLPVFECPPGTARNGEKCYLIETKPPKIHYQINVTTKQAAPVITTGGKKHKKHH